MLLAGSPSAPFATTTGRPLTPATAAQLRRASGTPPRRGRAGRSPRPRPMRSATSASGPSRSRCGRGVGPASIAAARTTFGRSLAVHRWHEAATMPLTDRAADVDRAESKRDAARCWAAVSSTSATTRGLLSSATIASPCRPSGRGRHEGDAARRHRDASVRSACRGGRCRAAPRGPPRSRQRDLDGRPGRSRPVVRWPSRRSPAERAPGSRQRTRGGRAARPRDGTARASTAVGVPARLAQPGCSGPPRYQAAIARGTASAVAAAATRSAGALWSAATRTRTASTTTARHEKPSSARTSRSARRCPSRARARARPATRRRRASGRGAKRWRHAPTREAGRRRGRGAGRTRSSPSAEPERPVRRDERDDRGREADRREAVERRS